MKGDSSIPIWFQFPHKLAGLWSEACWAEEDNGFQAAMFLFFCILSWNILKLLVMYNTDLQSLIFCTETWCLNLPEAESDTQPVPDLQLINFNVGFSLVNACCPQIQRSYTWKTCVFEATEAELNKARPRATSNTELSVKPKKTRPVATPARNSREPHQESEPGSGNPAKLKRHRSKLPDPDKDRQIEELKKAGLLMALIVHVGWPYVVEAQTSVVLVQFWANCMQYWW